MSVSNILLYDTFHYAEPDISPLLLSLGYCQALPYLGCDSGLELGAVATSKQHRHGGICVYVKLTLAIQSALAKFERSNSKIYSEAAYWHMSLLLVMFCFSNLKHLHVLFQSTLQCINICLIASSLNFVLGLWRAVRLTLPYYTQDIS